MFQFSISQLTIRARTHRREINLWLVLPPRPGESDERRARVSANAGQVRINGVGRRLTDAARAGIEETLRTRWTAISGAISAFYKTTLPQGRVGDTALSVRQLTAHFEGAKVGYVDIQLLGHGQLESLYLNIPAGADAAQVTWLRGTWMAFDPDAGPPADFVRLDSEQFDPALTGPALRTLLRERWAKLPAGAEAIDPFLEDLASLGPRVRAGVTTIAAAVTGKP